jgi:hypothetical protein
MYRVTFHRLVVLTDGDALARPLKCDARGYGPSPIAQTTRLLSPGVYFMERVPNPRGQARAEWLVIVDTAIGAALGFMQGMTADFTIEELTCPAGN